MEEFTMVGWNKAENRPTKWGRGHISMLAQMTADFLSDKDIAYVQVYEGDRISDLESFR